MREDSLGGVWELNHRRYPGRGSGLISSRLYFFPRASESMLKILDC